MDWKSFAATYHGYGEIQGVVRKRWQRFNCPVPSRLAEAAGPDGKFDHENQSDQRSIPLHFSPTDCLSRIFWAVAVRHHDRVRPGQKRHVRSGTGSGGAISAALDPVRQKIRFIITGNLNWGLVHERATVEQIRSPLFPPRAR